MKSTSQVSNKSPSKKGPAGLKINGSSPSFHGYSLQSLAHL